MHVDGFRFDLAATLARGEHTVDTWSSFFATIHQDPVLQGVKLIAEPWDTGANGYQVGNFPFHWSEWNDKYRESIRSLWRNGGRAMPEVACRVTGSADLFQKSGRRPSASINYIASHDGLTLHDLAGAMAPVSHLGGTDARPQAHRRLQRNLMATLLLSMGTPMLSAGDEWGRTQQGHDNPYDQDNAISWLDRSTADDALLTLTRRLLALRHEVPWLQQDEWQGHDLQIQWLREDGREMTHEDWQQPRTHLALCGRRGESQAMLLINAGSQPVRFTVPPSQGDPWRLMVNTACGCADVPLSEADGLVLEGPAVALLMTARPGRMS
jgi:glycogen operon protein